MSEIKDGGPAFPKTGRVSSENRRMEEGQVGMTLRDYFAAKAMIALASLGSDFSPVRDADVCYEVADAMLRARGVA